MDYGPFGWMDQYDPLFAKWTGSGEHFAFINQPNAALANFQTLAMSCAPLLENGEDYVEVVMLASPFWRPCKTLGDARWVLFTRPPRP